MHIDFLGYTNESLSNQGFLFVARLIIYLYGLLGHLISHSWTTGSSGFALICENTEISPPTGCTCFFLIVVRFVHLEGIRKTRLHVVVSLFA